MLVAETHEPLSGSPTQKSRTRLRDVVLPARPIVARLRWAGDSPSLAGDHRFRRCDDGRSPARLAAGPSGCTSDSRGPSGDLSTLKSSPPPRLRGVAVPAPWAARHPPFPREHGPSRVAPFLRFKHPAADPRPDARRPGPVGRAARPARTQPLIGKVNVDVECNEPFDAAMYGPPDPLFSTEFTAHPRAGDRLPTMPAARVGRLTPPDNLYFTVGAERADAVGRTRGG